MRRTPWPVFISAPILGAATAVAVGMVLAAGARGLNTAPSMAACFRRSVRDGSATDWTLCDRSSARALAAEPAGRAALADLTGRLHAGVVDGLIRRSTHMSVERFESRAARVDLADWWINRPDGLQTLRIARVSAGWPLPCLTGWHENEGAGPFVPRDERAVGLIAAPAWLATTPRPPALESRLPTLPLWTGIIVDTLVMAVAWTAVLLAFGAFKRGVLGVWRRFRRRCPACGYARAGLTAGAACPECGC